MLKEEQKKNIKYTFLLLCLIAFLKITEEVFEKEIMTMDIVVYNAISEFLISDAVTPVMKIITYFGSALGVLTIGLIPLVLLKNKKLGLCVYINLVIVAILNQILKYLFQRDRPEIFRIVDATGYSFPSGHTMVSTAFYGFLIYLIYKNVKNKYVKWGGILILSILILLIGMSRIYLGVHYTSDVLAGLLLSVAYLIVFTSVIKKLGVKIGE